MSAAPRKATIDALVARSEQISLESDLSETRAKPNPAQPLATFVLRNRARDTTTTIAVLRDAYVACGIERRARKRSHTVDLRFVDPKPRAYRRIAWRWLYAALLVSVLAASAVLACVYFHRYALVAEYGLSIAIVLVAGALCCFTAAYYYTIETILFVSTHGRAPVIGLSGNLGTFRRARACVAQLVKHIDLAHMQFRQSKAAQLRDEMREHARLFEQGAFNQKQYEDAKLRILKAHD